MELIEGAVQSTAGLADVIYVGDTGSSDDTIEKAKSLGCEVIEGLDHMNLGQSRNIVIERAEQDGADWVVILDCDERIANPDEVRAFLSDTVADALYVRQVYYENGRSTLEVPTLRVWRKGVARYKFRIHEVPIQQVDHCRIEHTSMVWEHYRPSTRNAEKAGHFLECLLLDVAENPDASRCKFYLARQYVYLGEWQQALEAFENYFEHPDHDLPKAYEFVAKIYGELGDEQKQIEALYKSLAADPHRRDSYGLLAEIYYNKKEYRLAAAILRGAIELPVSTKGFVFERWYGSYIYDLLARCYYYAGQYDAGYPFALKALALNPDDARLRKNLNWFLERVER